MFLTSRIQRKDTINTAYSTNVSRISKRFTTQQTLIQQPASQKSVKKQDRQYQKINPIAKLDIKIKRQKVCSPDKSDNQSYIKVNPLKYPSNVITKTSSQQHGQIVSYGVSTFKGFNHVVNPHFLSVNLGSVKNIIFAQSFDGTAAAKMIRQKFPLQLIDLSLKSQFKNPQQMIFQAFKRTQNKIQVKQQQIKDNSGSCFLSVIIRNDLILVANSGCTQAICGTKNGSVLKLSEAHTTKNNRQIKRIIKSGGTFYQTVVNLPFQQQLQISGPMRLSPSGLIYTRCLGRVQDFKKLQNGNPQQGQQPQNLTWKPQIKYIKASQVLWLGIFSESVLNNCSLNYIQECVNNQMKHRSQSYSEHHIASQISRKIINHVINKGVPDAISVIIMFLGNLKVQKSNQVIQTSKTSVKAVNSSNNNSTCGYKNQRRLNSNSSSKQSSLTYLGNRKSFIKEVDNNCNSYSISKTLKSQRCSNQKRLKKDFSFNTFY